MAGQLRTIDRWGNPVSGPNRGRDLARLRVLFLQRLVPLDGFRDHVVSSEYVRASIRNLEVEFEPLLAEPPYRAILAQRVGRTLARIGDSSGATEYLSRTWADVPYDGVGLTLANIQAAAGDLKDAASTLEKTFANRQTPAGGHLAIHLLIRIAVESRDARLLEAAVRSIQVNKGGASPIVMARARLWWDQVETSDCELPSIDVVPDGEAVACLARWRLGATAAADPDGMTESADRNPDASFECQAARAAALLAQDRPEEALEVVRGLMRGLEDRVRVDFRAHQVEDLARAIRVKALYAGGHNNQAIEEAKLLRGLLKPGLLPAILVEEVLRDTRAGG
jgi:hypothetical protein